MNTTHALELAKRGFKVFPIAAGAKAPPLINSWPTWATDMPAQICEWWTERPDANIGIHCEGLLVIDVDIKKGGHDALELLRLSEDLPATLCTRTPTGGEHLFYRLPSNHLGVPNSVQALGRGLDIRSTGGYVVAPGSTTPGGTYAFVDATVPVAEAPEWLLRRLGDAVVQAKRREMDAPIADAAEAVWQRARDWLADQAPAIEGSGGDAHTYAVACGLRDAGVSAMQAFALLQDVWNQRCEPPWDLDDLWTKVHNAYRYAQNEPGVKAVQASMFKATVELKPALVAAPVIKAALTLAEFAGSEEKSAGYVIKGLLQRSSYAEAFGAPGQGKTFIALDMAYHVAADLPWMEKKIHPGPVLYLAYEGTGGMKKRAKALRQKYGRKDVPFYFHGATMNLREKSGREELGALIAGLPATPVLIVIDTFARALMGGDENSAQDVGAFNSAIGALIESTGACVLIVHHSGKDKSKGARGSSALLGAIDTEIEIDEGQVVARKQRDVEIGEPIGFKLVPVIVGIDEDGDEQTSCVVEPSAVGGQHERLQGKNNERAWSVLCKLSPNNEAVDILDWKEACGEFLGPKALRQRFHDIKAHLESRGFIKTEKGFIQRRLE